MNKQKPAFEQALEIASFWCNAWNQGELSDEVLADKVLDLLKQKEGARGFFVISLSSDCPLMDRLPEPLIFSLRAEGEYVIDLTIKNMAMSSAMAIFHKRNKNSDQQNSSERIKRRCIELLRLLEAKLVKERLEVLLEATQGNGKDVEFLRRWNYDEEQISAISESIHSIAEN